MTVAVPSANRAPHPSGLADVLDLVLDKGIVIDAYVRLSLVGIEILTLDARVVIASVDTYLRFAEAANRLELGAREPEALSDIVGDISQAGARGIAQGKARGAVDAGLDRIGELLKPDKRGRSTQRR